jgi:adenylate kinase family enzyme
MASSAGVAIVLTGAPGAGESTVAESLATRLARGAHSPMDVFRWERRTGFLSELKHSRRAAGAATTVNSGTHRLILVDRFRSASA